MERLTTNKPVDEMSMLELAYNSCYAKDGKAMYRDYDIDIDARELTEYLYKKYAEIEPSPTAPDELFDDWMLDDLQKGMDSIEGVLALLYRNLWAMADMRERLKAYEDKQEQGLLVEKDELERYKLALFGVIRNSNVMPTGLALGKSMKEINAFSLKTMEEVLKMVDCNTMGKHYSEAEEALAKMGGNA